ncbi:hypothetical protein JWJ90_17355 [Desulfobulbus rhabdoformis]|jgi:hypothetical protein|uniref:hypothetical protein n=1 Tax=Desulfobulbus rhabdoformis TaxID=34032 RepID=UPI001963B5A9|nr:hypothetical protein [Desulfobulbus rhabdoformis]MBM9616039.1 hypothetical protein [Desulfobulbus rhabdoformis]
MSEEKIRFLSYEDASRLVGAIQEEEDIDRANHRILTVYSNTDKELCWYDFEEVMRDAGVDEGDPESKEKVSEYILHHLPDWVLDI